MRRSYILAGAVLVAAQPLPVAFAQRSAAQSISQDDKAIGAKAHPEILNEFGGAYVGPQSDYVRQVGQRISVQSRLSNAATDFTVTTLNSPVNNAFAIPGGYVYVTRQLLALMNDEAELASVLGHETAHVAARHSQKRQSAATRNTVLGALGQVLSGVLLGNSALGQAASQAIGGAAQFFTLRFSRSQEYEADDLGVRYLAAAGYDPMASSTMLASLAAQSALDARTSSRGERGVPEWASTHPDPASRVTRAAQKATATGARGGVRNRDAFLNALDGVLYDDDPRQGVVDGQTFRHPELRLEFTAPDGFAITNGTRAVTISGTSAQAQFAGGAFGGSLDRYIAGVFEALSGGRASIDYDAPRPTRVNGIDAAFAQGRANTQSGPVDITVYAYAFDAKAAYHFVVLSRAGTGADRFGPMFASFRRITAAEAASIRPRRIDVVTVRSGDTVDTLAARMAYASLQRERFLTLNALPAGTALRPGQRVKIVVFG